MTQLVSALTSPLPRVNLFNHLSNQTPAAVKCVLKRGLGIKKSVLEWCFGRSVAVVAVAVVVVIFVTVVAVVVAVVVVAVEAAAAATGFNLTFCTFQTLRLENFLEPPSRQKPQLMPTDYL